MGILGVAMIFLSMEILNYFKMAQNQFALLLIQFIGALYFGFAMLNWMAKGLLAGGIYGRPVVIGNMTHFIVATLPMLKTISSESSLAFLILSIIYLIFTLAFIYIFYTAPKQVKVDY